MLVSTPEDPPTEFDAARQSMAIVGAFEMSASELDAAEHDHVPALKIHVNAPPMPLWSAVERERAEERRQEQEKAEMDAYAQRNSHWSGPPLIITDGDGNNVIEFQRPTIVFDDAPPANLPSVIQLSPDQATAIDMIMAWIGSGLHTLTLGGLAGTGKSTLMNTVVQNYHARIAVCAFTGKAAHVLKTKGVKQAQTIHSLIYEPITTCTRCGSLVEDHGEGHGSKKPRCKRPSCAGAKATTRFEKVMGLNCDLIIVDEASMVSTQIHEDLLSFNIPILYVGDHGQLEPIGMNPRLLAEPQIRLEKIHRQAEGNSILRFAHHVRNHGRPQEFPPDTVVIEATTAPKDVADYDMVICGRNGTRVAVNAAIRKARGHTTDLPAPGEQVICLRNNKQHNIFNGMLAEVVGIRVDDVVSHPEIDIRLDNGEVRYAIRFEPEQFGNEKLLDDAHRKVALFDFGYCLTCHKSQGSQWDNVLVLEWIHGDTSAARWRYTAATRAKFKLTWCMRPQPRGRQ